LRFNVPALSSNSDYLATLVIGDFSCYCILLYAFLRIILLLRSRFLKKSYSSYAQPAAQSKVLCGTVQVFAVVKVAYLLAICP